MKKVTPLFPGNPLQKLRSCSALPLFENLVGGSTPQQKGVGGGGHYADSVSLIFFLVVLSSLMQIINAI